MSKQAGQPVLYDPKGWRGRNAAPASAPAMRATYPGNASKQEFELFSRMAAQCLAISHAIIAGQLRDDHQTARAKIAEQTGKLMALLDAMVASSLLDETVIEAARLQESQRLIANTVPDINGPV